MEQVCDLLMDRLGELEHTEDVLRWVCSCSWLSETLAALTCLQSTSIEQRCFMIG